MKILGLNAYHGDASACLISDGQIIAAAEEERFRRVKHWAGFPSEAIRYCLQEGGVGLDQIDHVAINSDPSANLLKKLTYTIWARPSLSMILDRVRNQKERQSVQAELGRAFPKMSFNGRVHRVEHHLAHLASSFLVSPFKESVVVSVDGFGDFSSAAWGVGAGSEIRIDGRVYFPHSLGVFYQAMTQFIGFPHYGDEYKVMGLAPYGQPCHMAAMREIVLLNEDGSFQLNTRYFRHHNERFNYEWSGGSPTVGTLYSPALCELLGPARTGEEPLTDRHRDLARSVQAMYEEAFFHLLTKLHQRYQIDSIALAGGCAMNSVANGKIRRMSPFKRVYAQAAAGDAGGAIGAASIVWHKLDKHSTQANFYTSQVLAGDAVPNRFVMEHASWGPAATEVEIDSIVEERKADLKAQCCQTIAIDDEAELCKRVAKAVADGLVVGWFQGRMEWGPRALGNRSIVGDPRRANMKDILNLKIKRRESFRPFAPSILREHVADWFEEEADVPFMMQVFQIKEDKRPLVPAVTHVDGSGRLQTVHRLANPRYWRLIETFRELTGVPMVLNTSFNENEPVVCRPVEALDCFLRTKMDVLVLGRRIIERA